MPRRNRQSRAHARALEAANAAKHEKKLEKDAQEAALADRIAEIKKMPTKATLDLKDLLSGNIGCLCPECGPDGRGGANGLISPEMLKAKGALSKKGPAVDELKHHGINFEATEEAPKLDANWAKFTLTALMQKGAYYLSPIMTAIGLGSATGSAAAMDAEPAEPATTGACTETPVSSPAQKTRRFASPAFEFGSVTPMKDLETRMDRAGRKEESLLDQTGSSVGLLFHNDVGKVGDIGVSDRRTQRTQDKLEAREKEKERQRIVAIRSALFANAVTYEMYKLVNWDDYVENKILDDKEHDDVMEVLYRASNVVLEDNMKRARDLSDLVHDKARRRAADYDSRSSWPCSANKDPNRKVLKVDTCWDTSGYVAPNAWCHVKDWLTGCTVAGVHVSKDKDVRRIAEPGRCIMGFEHSSGDMDKHATIACFEYLTKAWPNITADVVKDGDVKGDHVLEIGGCGTWREFRCHCHLIKNLRKLLLGKMMTGAECPGNCGGDGRLCKNVKGWRFCIVIANKAYARVYDILGRAQLVAFPEWDEDFGSAELPIGVVDSEERKLMLAAAIAQAETELTSMVYHFIGECDKGGCTHGELPENHPRFKCKGQLKAFIKIIDTFKKQLPMALSPYGLVHINDVESDHAVIRYKRQKGIKRSAHKQHLCVNLGQLHCQQLDLGKWGVHTAYIEEIIKVLEVTYGVHIPVPKRERERLDADYQGRLENWRRRQLPRWMEVRRLYVARRRMSQKDQIAKAAYKSGGGEASHEADSRAANEKAFFGGKAIALHENYDEIEEAFGHEDAREDGQSELDIAVAI